MIRPMQYSPPVSKALLARCAISLLLSAAGCELIPLAAVGAAFDIAGSTVATGPAIYHQGKLDIAFMSEYPVVQQAVRSGAADLSLKVSCEHQAGKQEGAWEFVLHDDLKAQIVVTVERRSQTLCLCRVNVGFFGSEPTARLLMNRIGVHLPSAKDAEKLDSGTGRRVRLPCSIRAIGAIRG